MRLNPALMAISAEGFLTRLGFGMLGFALPLFGLSLGMGLAEVGTLYALSTGTALAVKPVMGWLADRFGRKRILAASVALRCVVGLLFVFAALPWHLYALRVLQGAATAAREPSAAALIAEHGNRRRMASAFAWYTTARDVGRSLGYAAAGALIQFTGDYQLVFLIAFLVSCAALVTVVLYVRDAPAAPPAAKPAGPAATAPRSAASWRRLLPHAGFGLTVAVSAEMMRGLFPIIATEYAHLSVGQAGVVASASSIAILIAGPLFGWVSDHLSRKLALGIRSIANTVSSLLYILFPGFAGFLIARVVDDTGKAAFRPTWGAILAEVSEVEPTRRARTMALVDSAHTLGMALGPLAAGLLIGAFGVPVMLGVRAAISLVAEVQALRLGRSLGAKTAARVDQPPHSSPVLVRQEP